MAPGWNKTEPRLAPGRFEWTAERERAAVLLAEDTLTDQQIATELNIGRTTLHRWKENVEFQARVADLVEQYRQAVAKLSISDKAHRVKALDGRWQKMNQVIEARAADPSMKDVPGGNTGLLVRTYKSAGGALMEEYSVDTGLLREMRGHEEQAAKELGQWTDKTSVEAQGGTAGAVIILPATNGGGIQP